MSQSTTYSGGMLITNNEHKKLFVGENSFLDADYTNGTGDDVVLLKGTVMGRIHASNKVTPMTSAATDGSQFPIGILADDYSVADGATKSVRFCTGGKVDRGLVILTGADTFATVVSDKTIEDRIGSDTVGIILISFDELSELDNQ